MATAQQVKRTAFLAIVVGIVTMGLSSKVEASSTVAALVTFVVGFGLAGVGVFKLERAAKAR